MADSKPTTLGETLRAERKRRGWDIPRMAQQLRAASDEPHKQPSLSSLQRNIERWETGQVTKLSERYRLLYATAFDIPDEQLFPTATPATAPADVAHDEDMERRQLLQALVALGAATSPAVDALHRIQDSVDRAIGGDDRIHLDEWEETVAEYGYTYVTHPPRRLLADLAADLVMVRSIMSRTKSTDRTFPSWCRVTSGLSTLMAKTLCNLGQPREARTWWTTAQQAADVSGDVDLSLWVSGEHLAHGMYERRPTPILLRKAEAIAERAAGTAPCRGMAHVHGIHAQLLAVDGQDSAARTELRRAGEVFAQLPTSVTSEAHSIAGWGEDRFRYIESFVYAQLGEREQLDQAITHAYALVPQGQRVRAQLGLLQAFGHVRAGDVSEGVQRARTVYNEQPVEQRTVMVTALAEQVLDAVPVKDRTAPIVAGYQELLSDSSRRAIT